MSKNENITDVSDDATDADSLSILTKINNEVIYMNIFNMLLFGIPMWKIFLFLVAIVSFVLFVEHILTLAKLISKYKL